MVRYGYVTDRVGSPMFLIHEGVIVEQYEFDAYGRMWVDNSEGTCESFGDPECRSAFGSVVGFQGGLAESCGVVEFGARFYLPTTGTWLSPDPLGYIDSVDEWLFVGGDPVNFVDPSGLSADAAEQPTQHLSFNDMHIEGRLWGSAHCYGSLYVRGLGSRSVMGIAVVH